MREHVEKLTPEHAERLKANLATVRADIVAAAEAAGRDPDSVTLVAVSKKHPAAAIQVMAEDGQLAFGESYVQEALAKQDELAEVALDWHFVGRLQTNKAKFVAGRFALAHSVDNLKLARTLHIKARDHGANQAILLQVNLAGETQKGGVEPQSAPQLAREILELDGVTLKGLMVMPPFGDPEAARPVFKGLRLLRDRLQDDLGVSLPELSMGMTGDFRVAVAEGATLVRIGTRLFGERPG